MKLLSNSPRLVALAGFVAICPVALSQQETVLKTAQVNAAEPHTNTVDGLHRLLDDLLLAAKHDDEAKLWSQIAEMQIPNYESWFTRTFGQEEGKKLASMYGTSPHSSDLHFEMLCMELAKQEGEISIEKVDTTKRYGLRMGPLDEYKANWRKTDTSAGPDSQSIGVFYFVDGKFRLNASFREVRLLVPGKRGMVVPEKGINFVPGKVINKVQPKYPEIARQLRIQGEVAVNVIVRKDGTVTVQNVGAGHPLLAPAAVEAVQQWRYEPTTVNDQPVDVQVKIYVVFASTKQ